MVRAVQSIEARTATVLGNVVLRIRYRGRRHACGRRLKDQG